MIRGPRFHATASWTHGTPVAWPTTLVRRSTNQRDFRGGRRQLREWTIWGIGRVALGSYPPKAPTDPDVRTLAHPVPQPTVSPSAVVPEAIRSSYGDMLIEPRCVRHVSLDRVCRPTLRFPPQGPPRRVPLLQQYYQSVTTSCRPSPLPIESL